ncbi:MAG: type VI secretion system tube protein Hcp [Gemmatimonas sp.]|nr:type VI secretion system tube protein Hcp [Gemmatimonas sp.]
MPSDIFIKLGEINGESKDKSHKDEIDVLAWSWGASNSGTFHTGGGGGAGKASVQDLSFTKWVDKASPEIFLACCAGTTVPNATLVVRKAGDKPLEYVSIAMDDVLITSYSTGGSGGEDRLTENVTLNFSKVKVGYVEQAPTGGEGDKPAVAWDIAANAVY